MLLVDLWEFFSDLGSGDRKKKEKSSENDQLTGHFQSFFVVFFHFQSFFFFFFIFRAFFFFKYLQNKQLN